MFLTRSGLPVHLLKQIWGLSDRPQNGSLTKEEFFVAMRFVAIAQSGESNFGDVNNTQTLLQTSQAGLPQFQGIETPEMSVVSNQIPPLRSPNINNESTNTGLVSSLPSASSSSGATPNTAGISAISSSSFGTPMGGGLGLQSSQPNNTAVLPPSPYDFKPGEKDKIKVWFKQVVDESGMYASGRPIVDFLQRSGADKQALRKIWVLSDVDKDNKLTLDEFCVAFKLALCVGKSNMVVPESLPASLLASITGNNSSDNTNGITAQEQQTTAQLVEPSLRSPPQSAVGKDGALNNNGPLDLSFSDTKKASGSVKPVVPIAISEPSKMKSQSENLDKTKNFLQSMLRSSLDNLQTEFKSYLQESVERMREESSSSLSSSSDGLASSSGYSEKTVEMFHGKLKETLETTLAAFQESMTSTISFKLSQVQSNVEKLGKDIGDLQSQIQNLNLKSNEPKSSRGMNAQMQSQVSTTTQNQSFPLNDVFADSSSASQPVTTTVNKTNTSRPKFPQRSTTNTTSNGSTGANTGTVTSAGTLTGAGTVTGAGGEGTGTVTEGHAQQDTAPMKTKSSLGGMDFFGTDFPSTQEKTKTTTSEKEKSEPNTDAFGASFDDFAFANSTNNDEPPKLPPKTTDNSQQNSNQKTASSPPIVETNKNTVATTNDDFFTSDDPFDAFGNPGNDDSGTAGGDDDPFGF
eukprot:g391.t1